MGRKSRLKKERQLDKVQREHNLSPTKREAFNVLRGIHQTIQGHCHESPRRCWEYMLEMLAHSTGWGTDTEEAKHLWEKMGEETRWEEFFQCWMDEVAHAKENRIAFSEPIGELLEDISGTSDHLGQYFTPMQIVRLMNEISMPKGQCEPNPDGTPSKRGMDPCCGTGRFMIDALVFNEGLFMHAIELDLWLMRAAMLNVRMLAKWTSLRYNLSDMLDPLNKEDTPESGGIILGGRSVFMNGDSLIVDSTYQPNWICAGWAWKPHPWQENLKITGFEGSYNEWLEAGEPKKELPGEPGYVQFDYSMKSSVDDKFKAKPLPGRPTRARLDQNKPITRREQ